jgi:hypothetical protein
MLRESVRYFLLLIWSSSLHRSQNEQDFMLGGTPSDSEHS